MSYAEDVGLNTVEWGSENSPHVALLLHGLAGRAQAFEEALAEKLLGADSVAGGSWRLLAPDLWEGWLRGCGEQGQHTRA